MEILLKLNLNNYSNDKFLILFIKIKIKFNIKIFLKIKILIKNFSFLEFNYLNKDKFDFSYMKFRIIFYCILNKIDIFYYYNKFYNLL